MTPEEIKNLRLSRNYSQMQLAMKMGVSQRAISHWENGNRPIRPEYQERLKEIFTAKKRVKKLKKQVKPSMDEYERNRQERVELMRRMDEKTDVPGKNFGNWHLLPDDDEDLLALRKVMNL